MLKFVVFLVIGKSKKVDIDSSDWVFLFKKYNSVSLRGHLIRMRIHLCWAIVVIDFAVCFEPQGSVVHLKLGSKKERNYQLQRHYYVKLYFIFRGSIS